MVAWREAAATAARVAEARREKAAVRRLIARQPIRRLARAEREASA